MWVFMWARGALFMHHPQVIVIRLDKLAQNYWQKNFIGARRVLTLE
jgi:hypothetical protein